jgi:hypothetical protein
LGVIKSMLKKYTPPNKEEGFDLCIYVWKKTNLT